jgi:hypothetical protein
MDRRTVGKESAGKADGKFTDKAGTALMGGKPRPTVLSGYAEGMTAMVFGKKVLVLNVPYLLGKHAKEDSVGSRLGEINSEDKIVKFLEAQVDEDTLKEIQGVFRRPNIPTGKNVDTDALVEIVSLRKDGEDVNEGASLEKGVEYAAVVRDAEGNEFEASVKNELVREEPPTYHPVAYSEQEQPVTDKLNLIIGQVDLTDERAGWVQSEELGKVVDLSEVEGVYAVFTIFPGTYAPAANEPLSSQNDELVGCTGNEFWRKHALMKKPDK